MTCLIAFLRGSLFLGASQNPWRTRQVFRIGTMSCGVGRPGRRGNRVYKVAVVLSVNFPRDTSLMSPSAGVISSKIVLR
jgi:hypothetical protein